MIISKTFEIECQQCKIKFKRFQYQIKKYKTHFCSRKCSVFYRWKTPSERLYNQTSKNNETECWIFNGLKDRQGYGKILRKKAHRLSWELNFGEIPFGMLICHKCDNPSCVNPNHLWLGTNADNQKDKISKGRIKSTFGSNHHSSKLKDEQIPLIRIKLKNCKNKSLLAKEYNITLATLNKIQKGITWKHVK